jgi:hypothetical protein
MDDMHCAVGHILFLIQNGKRFRTAFNTIEGCRIFVEEGNLEEVLLLNIDSAEFVVEWESSCLFPDMSDPAWRRM